MTENEAKILLCQMYLPQFDEKEKQALTMAIQALEEIQEYRAIGTVEEFDNAMCFELAKENKELSNVVDEYLQYVKLGTVEEFKALKEKNVAKKPILSKSMMTKREFQICPVCERLVLYDGIKFNYCQYCGQKLDWQ